MKNWLTPVVKSLLFVCLMAVVGCQSGRHTEVTISGDKFCINGEETFKGKTWRGYSIEGLLPNSRMVNGIFDDENPETIDRWAYPDTGVWDAERNVSEFIAAMPAWRESGLLAFTINLQGGSPQGYSKQQPWINTAIAPNGDLKPAYMDRLERVLDRADELGMVAIVGIYYFGQEKYMNDEESIYRGVENTVRWILERGYTNVMIEVNNESNLYKIHDILKAKSVHKLIDFAKGIEVDGRRLLVSVSMSGGKVPTEEIVASSDFILIHGNAQKTVDKLERLIDNTRAVKSYTTKPVVINEDDHFNFDQPMNNFVMATSKGVSWGYFDFRRDGEPFETGYQCIPADWGISTDRKKGFFNLLKEW